MNFKTHWGGKKNPWSRIIWNWILFYVRFWNAKVDLSNSSAEWFAMQCFSADFTPGCACLYLPLRRRSLGSGQLWHACCLPASQHGKKTKLSFLSYGKLRTINPRPLSGEENIINTNVSSPFYALYINHPTRAHGFPCSSLHLPCNYWEESRFVYKKLRFAKHCNRTEFRDSLAHPLRGERTERSHVRAWEEACWGSHATSWKRCPGGR